MTSRYLVLAVTVLLLASAPSALAVTGSYDYSPTMQGPLAGSVTFSVCSDSATCSGLLLGGNIQAAELPFDIGAWESICPPPEGVGGSPGIICGATASYEGAYIAFNNLGFPGDNVNFRRAMQFLQDYSYFENTTLQGILGWTTDQPAPCFAYSTDCNPTPMDTHYGTSQNLEAAGEELEMVTDGTSSTTLYCDNGGVQCNGTYGPTSEWCVGALGTGSGCGVGTAFSPRLMSRATLYRQLWAAQIVNWASQIGLDVVTYSPILPAGCYNWGQQFTRPGVYNPLTGYNSDPVISGPSNSAEDCPMITAGFYSSEPDLKTLLEFYNSQFDGGYVTVYDDPTFVTASDSIAGYAAATTHTTIYNLDYTTNEVFYATTSAEVITGAQDFMNAYALQVPTVFGYYLSTLYVDNANGWTGFVPWFTTGANELAGLRYTVMNAHTCSPTSCTININNSGSSIGGANFNVALEEAADPSGLNPLYNANWAWQADVYGNVYDTPLIESPPWIIGGGGISDYMTSSNVITDIPGAKVLGTGGNWFYFQEPCANPRSPNYATLLQNCIGHAQPQQTPGPLQRGIGLLPAARTVYNGREITLTFKDGIYFYDGVKVTANDYVFSLNLFDVAASPNLIDSDSPSKGTLGGPNGLIAAQMINSHGGPCSVDCPTVNLFLGSQSVWSLEGIITAMLPSHVFKYFNADHLSTGALGTLDTSLPYGLTATAFVIQGAPHPPASSWMWYLPNIEIGSGPYYLSQWNGAAGTGVEMANPFYFNPNWQAEANYTVLSPSYGYTITRPLFIDVYNPTFSPVNCGPMQPAPIAPGQSGLCQITNAQTGANKVKVYSADGLNLEKSLRLTKNPNTGAYSFTLPPSTGLTSLSGAPCPPPSVGCSKMPEGHYYAVLQTTYAFHGQSRTWYQVFGLTYA